MLTTGSPGMELGRWVDAGPPGGRHGFLMYTKAMYVLAGAGLGETIS